MIMNKTMILDRNPNLLFSVFMVFFGFSLMANADQMILDDLVVDGSICAGQDCVNGESFGFDTIRLKENNLRIRFVDTSTTSSFPSRDWQITINDSANGGANKFSIDDIDSGRTPFTIEGNAPSHSLFVDDAGKIGVGTSTPVVQVHVKDGNTPTLRLEQDGSSGFTPQTWDVAGNEANFFIRDATNGSTLSFRIRPSAPSSSIDIAADGDVGVGTDSPAARLHVRRLGDEEASLLINNAGNATTADFIVTADGKTGIGTATPAAELDVNGYLIRKIAYATGHGPADDSDSGQIASRVLSINKLSSSSVLKISYTDNFRTMGTQKVCSWEIKVDGNSCPDDVLKYNFYSLDSSENILRSTSVTGYCSGVTTTGAHEIQVWVDNTGGDCYTGWNNSTWVIDVEEVSTP